MMDSALCLHRGALQIPSITSRAAGLARPYSCFRPPSLSLSSKASTYPILSRHTFSSPLICARNNRSPQSPNSDKYNGKKNGTPRAPVLTRLKRVLDSMLKLNMTTAPVLTLKRVLDSRAPESGSQQDREDYDILKIAIEDLIKSGKCHVLETLLRRLYENIQGPEDKYNVEMELVLVLIFQGEYGKALECNCLKDEIMARSDGRIPFYKAIIYFMMGGDDEGNKHWEAFSDSISNQPPTVAESGF